MATSAVIMAEELLVLDVKCPRCGAPPRIRLVADQQGLFEESRGSGREPVLTYECHGRKCAGVFYPIPMGAFRRAR